MKTPHIGTQQGKPPLHRIVMLILSIGFGGAGVYFANQYIEAKVDGYRQQYAKSDTMVDIVVPSRDLTRGEVVSTESMSIRSIPTQYVDTHSVTAESFEIAEGQRLDFDIDAGSALLWAHLEGGLSPTFSGRVPDGMRALTVLVDEINSVSGFLQPQDRIDMLFTYGDGKNQVTRPIIENLSVIATGIQTMVDKAGHTGQRAFNTITVQVTPINAKKITLAQQVGTLTAVLRNPEDETSQDSGPITLASLINPDQKLGSVKQPVLKPKAKPKVAKPSVEFIIGGRQ